MMVFQTNPFCFISIADKNEKWYTPSGKCQIWLKKGKDGRLEVDSEAAKVVKMIFKMAAEGTSFADITRELNRQAIATCDEQKLSRGDQVQFQRFDTNKRNTGVLRQ